MAAGGSVVVTTHTGEPVQPARLRFRVVRRSDVERALLGLECVFRNADRSSDWQWHYSDEADGLDFPKRTDQIPKAIQPVVLAEMSFSDPRRLVMRLRSPDRAIAAARFFCPRFGDAAVLERARILNRFVTPAEAERGIVGIDQLLERRVTVIDPEEGLRELEQLLARGRTHAEKLALLMGDRAARRKRDVPEVEDFPIDMEDETPTFNHLSNALRFRGLRAYEHWRGRKVTLAELIEDTLARAGAVLPA